MESKYLYSNKFIGSKDNYDDSKIVIVGIPMDYTSSYRAGSRFGPDKIREVSIGIEEYSPYLDSDLNDCSYIDMGNLDLPIGNVDKSLKIIEEIVDQIITDGKKPLLIGGEHLITYPVVKSINKVNKDFCVLQFDAHADLRNDYLGVSFSHATVIRKVSDIIKPENIYQFGIRSGTKDEFNYGKKYTNFYPFKAVEGLKECLEALKGRNIYLTIDIDIVDPAYACGTGTPEPGGITSSEMIQITQLLSGLNIIGFDIVEVSPDYDVSDKTSFLAAKIIRELLLIMG